LSNQHSYSYIGIGDEITEYSSTSTGGAGGVSAFFDLGYRINPMLNLGMHIDYFHVNEDAFKMFKFSSPTTFGMVSYGVFNEFFVSDFFAYYVEVNFTKDKQISKPYSRSGTKIGLGFHYSFKKAPTFGFKMMPYFLNTKLQGFEDNAPLYENYYKRGVGLELGLTIDFGWYDPKS
jgi:hypothetical protein